MTLEASVRQVASDAGLVGIGFCAADPFPEVRDRLEDARTDGRSASLGFTYSDPSTAADPRATAPWARSIVVAALAYLPAAGDPGPAGAGTGRIARFATEDHYAPLRAALDTMAGILQEAGHRTEIRCDDSRLVDRAVAVRAGIGWWGLSTMVLAPGVGPWMLLGAILTDAEFAPTGAMARSCGTCDACIPACPTGALVGPGRLDARRCLAAILQTRGVIPRELRSAVGDRVYGCDDCLSACPPGSRLAGASRDPRGRVDLIGMIATADRPLRTSYEHFFVPRNEGRWMRRNAIVALANSPTPDADLVLAGLVGHGDPMIRMHAAWGLGAVGGPVALAALRARRAAETDPDVRHEIEAALDAAAGTLARCCSSPTSTEPSTL